MKTIHISLIILGLLIVSCSKPEPGSIELSNLSKKVFDTLKGGDESKFELLIPDEKTFTLYRVVVEKDSGKSLGDMDNFNGEIINEYKNFRSVLGEINGATHTNYTEELAKTKATTRAVITTKFSMDGNFTKYKFDAVKLNGRWFCMGNFQLIQSSATN
ncbi:MAG: hypothetical protein IPG60_11555 [Bacteroidetes bacterium]|nr:hypothetical protein [Bacteroidota bacterium]MBP7398651.1 hypothetical protein [Chitinophagales bacterium]MBK7109596.1 hypothetical protein [Bacteroidota bacterium]MBK8487670.1 hypothetical protein [Bacteroidota bacterium]MBK8682588.1 hypothetical protein [Bacteroidota bacterium]